MKTTPMSPQSGGDHGSPATPQMDQAQPGDPLSEWRGALEYDREHGDEVLTAKRECVAQGHNLSGAE
jgi:hypothetical protein